MDQRVDEILSDEELALRVEGVFPEAVALARRALDHGALPDDPVASYRAGLGAVGGQKAVEAALAVGLRRYADIHRVTLSEAFMARLGVLSAAEVLCALADVVDVESAGMDSAARAAWTGWLREDSSRDLVALLGWLVETPADPDGTEQPAYAALRPHAPPPPDRPQTTALVSSVLTSAPPCAGVGLLAASAA
ncbi:hypothetical protein [Streptomyces sp. YPW6]|uniref:hypothetical protein n=1 Tax=Streptomyces sp. YPW6 TaxID=2840373 RepID=UPI003EBD22B9